MQGNREMKDWFGTLVSKWARTDDGEGASQGSPPPTKTESVKSLNELRLKQLSEGWGAGQNVHPQGELAMHWTAPGKYDASLPAISSDSLTHLDQFLAQK